MSADEEYYEGLRKRFQFLTTKRQVLSDAELREVKTIDRLMTQYEKKRTAKRKAKKR